ncbi:MAG: hypothetical protein ABW007_14665 [Chitinophagaceae bacterium]
MLPPPETNDSIYISQVIELDTMFTTGLDTAQHTIYKYDASGRLSYVWFGEYFRGVPGADLTDDYYYFYNGSDSLPYKIVNLAGSRGYSAGFTIGRYDTTYLFYNGAGIVIKDSVCSANEDQVYQSTTVSTFTRIDDGHYRIDRKKISATGVSTNYTNSHFVRVNGNLLSSKDTTFDFGSGINVVSIESLSYDSKPNPLLRTVLRYPTSTSYGNVLGESAVNNFTRWQARYEFTPSFGYDYLEIYEYKYRADGYPILRLTKDQVEPSLIRKYIYTKR